MEGIDSALLLPEDKREAALGALREQRRDANADTLFTKQELDWEADSVTAPISSRLRLARRVQRPAGACRSRGDYRTRGHGTQTPGVARGSRPSWRRFGLSWPLCRAGIRMPMV